METARLGKEKASSYMIANCIVFQTIVRETLIWHINWKDKNKSEIIVHFIVSEWLLLNAYSAIFQIYHDDNKLIINEMMIRSALY
jgi:hypothetical protein